MARTHVKRHTAAALGVVALALSACAPSGPGSSADGAVLSLASPLSPSGPPGQSLQWWADEVAERTDGVVEVEIHASASLLPSLEGLAGTQDGRADMALTYSGYQAQQMPLFGMSEIPFVTSNGVAEAHAFHDLYKSNSTMQAEFDRVGVVPLVFVPVGNSALGANKSVDSLGDLKGLRIRVPGERLAKMLEPLEAEGVSIELTQAYEALQRGVLDGWTGTEMASVADASWQEVSPHFVQTGQGTIQHAVVFISQDSWETLTPEHQQILQEAGRDYLDWFDTKLIELEAAACDRILDAGATVTVLPADETEQWDTLAGDAAVEGVRQAAVAQGVSDKDFDELFTEYQDAIAEHVDSVEYSDGLTACAERSK